MKTFFIALFIVLVVIKLLKLIGEAASMPDDDDLTLYEEDQGLFDDCNKGCNRF